jgi:hypothetical protein
MADRVWKARMKLTGVKAAGIVAAVIGSPACAWSDAPGPFFQSEEAAVKAITNLGPGWKTTSRPETLPSSMNRKAVRYHFGRGRSLTLVGRGPGLEDEAIILDGFTEEQPCWKADRQALIDTLLMGSGSKRNAENRKKVATAANTAFGTRLNNFGTSVGPVFFEFQRTNMCRVIVSRRRTD